MSLQQARYFQRLGVPATVAEVFRDVVAPEMLQSLARTFSRPALRALLQRHESAPLTSMDWRVLNEAAAGNLASTRAYVSRTALPVRDIARLVAFGVRYSSYTAWNRAFTGSGEDLVTRVHQAVIVHDVPESHLDDWIRFAAQGGASHLLTCGQGNTGWAFVGAGTGLLAQAGLSPAEARSFVRAGEFDESSLMFLAGMRARSRSVG